MSSGSTPEKRMEKKLRNAAETLDNKGLLNLQDNKREYILETGMATKKKSSSKRSSSGSDPKSKRTVKNKMQKVMHEYKHHELESGRSHKKVKNPKQAIAIGLSEARRSGANIPPNPSKKKAAKKSGSKKAASKKTGSKKSASSKKSTSKKSASKK
jgi:hypothetical protein